MENLEKTLLGLLMYDDKIYFQFYDRLHPELFQTPKYRQIFIGISEVCKDSGVLDIVSVNSKLKGAAGIFDEIADIEAQNMLDDIDPNNVIDELTESYKRLELQKLGSILSFSENVDSTETIKKISEVLNSISSAKTNIVDFKEAVAALTSYINEKKEGLTGIPSGFKEYDLFAKGFHDEDLILVAGETSQGKTSWSISAAVNAASYNFPVYIKSLEMSRHQLVAKTLSNKSELSAKDVLFGDMNDDKKKAVTDKLKSIEDLPIYIDDTGTNDFNSIVNTIKRYKIQKDIKLAVVDYLQLVGNPTKGANREQEIAGISRGFKNLAKELEIPIILISQLKRADNPVPTVKRLRDSGQIEESADVIVLLFRPEEYEISLIELNGTEYDTKGMGIIDIAKGRGIGKTKFPMKFEGRLTKWSDYEEIGGFVPVRDYDNPRIEANHGDTPF
jgi:replicative DNA helicase